MNFMRITSNGQVTIPIEIREKAGLLAGKCFLAYGGRGARKTSTLPDHCIGAHAALAGYRLLTRDVARCRTHFPGSEILVP
jgi:predicted nucleic acid-binding protein